MKNIFLFIALALSSQVFAAKDAIVFPQVYNFGSNVQVQVWNTTDRWITCSGSVNMTFADGKTESQHYFESVSSRFTSYRTIFPRSSSERISFVNHTIFCN